MQYLPAFNQLLHYKKRDEIMRIAIPPEDSGSAIAVLGKYYAQNIVTQALSFSKATYEWSSLSLREFEAGRARTAEINGCLVCQSFRAARDVTDFISSIGNNAEQSIVDRGPPPDEAFYTSVSQWKTATIYSERERLIIEYAEGMGTDPQRIAADEEFWGRFKARFRDEELVDLTYCIACWIGLGRAAHVLGLDGACELPRVSSRLQA